MWVLTLLGNCTVLLIIKTEVRLHTPMYFFLSMLAINDRVITTSTLPKFLASSGSQEISFDTCLLQMYFTHTFPIIESGTLLATACDQYVATCCLLQYATILSNPAVIKMGLVAATAGGAILILLCPVLTLRLPYCSRKLIPHTYCERTAGVKLACADTTVSRIDGVSVALLVVGLDMILVAASYSIILRAVFRPSSSEALATCTAHLCTLLVSCTPALFTLLTHRINRDMPPHSHILLASLCLLVPPLVNPLVYGMKTKKIHDRVSSIVNQGKKIASKP